MPSWTDGYVTDIQYASGFYRELSPTYLAYLCDLIGVRAPDIAKPFTYCELGCGQGLGSNLLAATHPNGAFYAYDFNPAQIANAQMLATAGGLTNIRFLERSFQELAEEPPHVEPLFDFIVFHGIISWIMPEHFQHIVTFLQRRLRPGGLVYASYNCLPGWTAMTPLQRLLREYAKQHPGRSDYQLREGLAFTNTLQQAGAAYFSANPGVPTRLEKLSGLNQNYLAHEYLNEAWVLFYFADVARELERAKLSFVGSAFLFDNFDHLCVPEKVRPLVKQARDPIFAQTIRDFAINRQFRRDLFVRGTNRIGMPEQTARLRQTTFQLLQDVVQSPLRFKVPLGEVTANPAQYDPVVKALRAKPASLGDVLTLPELAGRPFGEVSQTLAILVGDGLAHPVADRKLRSVSQAQALNRAVARRALLGDDYAFLGAPAAGTAIPATFMDMCILLALSEKSGTPKQADIIDDVWRLLGQYGRRLIKKGVTLETRQDSAAELELQVSEFFTTKYPYWKTLGIL